MCLEQWQIVTSGNNQVHYRRVEAITVDKLVESKGLPSIALNYLQH